MHKINNLNVKEFVSIPTPHTVKSLYPLTSKADQVVYSSRNTLQQILTGHDARLFAVVGPCSIHDPQAALEYAHRLKKLSEVISDNIFVVMRVYFEKPRTTVGWKGLINDPDLNDTFEVEKGLKIARKLMLDISHIGLPIGTEALDPISPQYLADLVSWSAIGARTTESQTHREMASGLSCPVGFKNGTDGGLEVAVNAMLSAATPHSFLGINEQGVVSIVKTKGNRHGHIILRGGTQGVNYDSVSVSLAQSYLEKAQLPANIVIDCSHGNSNKNYRLQSGVLHDVIRQKMDGNTSIKGVMLESHLQGGNQKISKEMQYGMSVTDGCLDWEETEAILLESAKKLRNM